MHTIFLLDQVCFAGSRYSRAVHTTACMHIADTIHANTIMIGEHFLTDRPSCKCVGDVTGTSACQSLGSIARVNKPNQIVQYNVLYMDI